MCWDGNSFGFYLKIGIVCIASWRYLLSILCTKEDYCSLLWSFGCTNIFFPLERLKGNHSGSFHPAMPLLVVMGMEWHMTSVLLWSSRLIQVGLSGVLSSIMTLSVFLLKERHTRFKRGLPWNRFVSKQ